MISYKEWKLQEDQSKLWELYLMGQGIAPIAEKVVKHIKGVVPNPKSFLVVKFQGTREDVDKVEDALKDISVRVVDSEIEHD